MCKMHVCAKCARMCEMHVRAQLHVCAKCTYVQSALCAQSSHTHVGKRVWSGAWTMGGGFFFCEKKHILRWISPFTGKFIAIRAARLPLLKQARWVEPVAQPIVLIGYTKSPRAVLFCSPGRNFGARGLKLSQKLELLIL